MVKLYNNCLVCLFSGTEHFGLFLADDDSKKGLWLESGRALEYYLLRTGVGVMWALL